MAPWEAASIASVEANGTRIGELNPVWYSAAHSGDIVVNWNGEKPTVTRGARFIPTIQNATGGKFDKRFGELLADPAFRERHASEIAALVEKKHYDGIDIDYEGLPATSRDDLNQFLALLASRLHRHRRELSVTLHPRTDDSQNWDGPGAQDWRFIGRIADSVKVMAYDFHYQGGEGGALSPLKWLDDIASYADTTIRSRKVMIGLPWYGYDWQGTTATAIGFDEALKLAVAKGAEVRRDENGEPYFAYADHLVYFEDAESYSRKVSQVLHSHRSIAGIAHWRSGREDPAVWTQVGALHQRRLRLPLIMLR